MSVPTSSNKVKEPYVLALLQAHSKGCPVVAIVAPEVIPPDATLVYGRYVPVNELHRWLDTDVANGTYKDRTPVPDTEDFTPFWR